jgi:hypothetical protein
VNSLPFVVARSLLYEQVWVLSMPQLARQFGVSYYALTKACRSSDIPLPPQGYWLRLQHGKAVISRPPLPPMPVDQSEEIVIHTVSKVAVAASVVDVGAAAEPTPQNRIEVAERLHQPHQLVQSASVALAEAKIDYRGKRRSQIGSRTTPSALEVRVSPVSQNRALRLLDALIKALETRGYEVTAKGVLIEGEYVPIALIEKDIRTPHVATPAELARKRQYSWETIPAWDYAPNGLLFIYSDAHFWKRPDIRKQWSEGRTARLEDMLDDVADGLVLIGSALRHRTDERRRESEMWAERERVRQEQARQARMEKARRENLFATADAWDRAGRIRKLIAEIERRATADNGLATTEMSTWIAWAKRVADGTDPLEVGMEKLLRTHERVALCADCFDGRFPDCNNED